LSVLGLMSNGAKTILLSRWRTGGQSSYDIVREFAQELPHATPADAWQRAVLVTADSRLNLEAEPRIKKATVDDPPRGNHPFFWAGYMLVDRGQKPEVVEEEDLPVVKEKKEKK
jgi:CHAT domain-containing protein